jgi:tetratricopeptide (TPR) repeat protein
MLLIFLLGGCAGNQYQKQLDLGYKFLQEEKYEEAIIAMNKAIDIDDKRPEAYIGLGDVFVTRCDENTVSDASDALKRGYEKSKSDLITKAFLDLADKLVDKGKTDWAIELLDIGYQVTKDVKLKDKGKELQESIQNSEGNRTYKIDTSDFVKVVSTSSVASYMHSNMSDLENTLGKFILDEDAQLFIEGHYESLPEIEFRFYDGTCESIWGNVVYFFPEMEGNDSFEMNLEQFDESGFIQTDSIAIAICPVPEFNKNNRKIKIENCNVQILNKVDM